MKRERVDDIKNMNVKDLFKLRTLIRKEQYDRWQTEIPKMLKTLPSCITNTFGDIEELWKSDSTRNEWSRQQAFKNKPTWFELNFFLTLDPIGIFKNGRLSDNLWKIEIKGQTEDGAEYYTPDGRRGGDQIIIEFLYLQKERYYHILQLSR